MEDSDQDTRGKLKEKVVFFQLIRDCRQSLDLLQEIERMDPENAKDPEHLKIYSESCVAEKDYEKASTFLDLLKCPSQGTKLMKLLEDEHFAFKIYLQAARDAIDQDCSNATAHFRSTCQEAMVVTNASPSLESSPRRPQHVQVPNYA